MISSPPELHEQCSKFFKYIDFIECGETQARLSLANLPQAIESYFAIKDLAVHVMDAVWDKFGAVELTYGFSSTELIKHIPGRVSPTIDQHAAYEKRRTGNYVCRRLGAACDFKVVDKDMRIVAEWVYFNTPVDSIYFYGSDHPIHVSFSHKRPHRFVEMLLREDGRRVPRVIKLTRPSSVNEV